MPVKVVHDIALEPGDVYCTRHSNLRDVQVLYDSAWFSHPCLNGIRNIIRLTIRLGITSIHIPLLLVEQACENMTIAWCMKRAEMVFKCVKGYLMEVSQSGVFTPTGSFFFFKLLLITIFLHYGALVRCCCLNLS
uniref:O-fucosyltransferase family protein n=1 Tax=Angiostrongylus cantonensis TaxID=6313 RepID=A0A0K0D8Q4_ANGCA